MGVGLVILAGCGGGAWERRRLAGMIDRGGVRRVNVRGEVCGLAGVLSLKFSLRGPLRDDGLIFSDSWGLIV